MDTSSHTVGGEIISDLSKPKEEITYILLTLAPFQEKVVTGLTKGKKKKKKKPEQRVNGIWWFFYNMVLIPFNTSLEDISEAL